MESLRTRLWRHVFNCFPAYRGTGGRVRYIADDWSRVQVVVPRNWRTRNLFGTTFGGSIYGAIDPIYAVMLSRRLGKAFTVWDREAHIEFHEPGESTLYADFRLPTREVRAIRDALDRGESTERTYDVRVVDAEGVVHATCEKTVYVRRDP
jgi:acyl-coenzyme A thioesterase PaaI-like protein